MTLYAQTLIEVTHDDKSVTLYKPGDQVPASIDGKDELVKGGALGSSKPETKHVTSGDSGSVNETSG